MLHPHDAFFRLVFEAPENAEGELRAVLPEALAAAIDWASLRHEPGSFVDEELRAQHTDLLFSVQLAGRPALVYVLLEHQSTSDPWMAARLLRYVSAIWASLLRSPSPPARLPIILPIVVHNGEHPWRAPTSLAPLLDADEPLRALLGPLLPSFTFRLDDLAGLDEQVLRRRSLSAVALLGLSALREVRRHGDPARTLAALVRWSDALRQLLSAPNGHAIFSALVRYLLFTTEVQVEALVELFTALGPGLEAAMKSTGERMTEEAEARGEARGAALGEARGRAEALLNQLRLKFGPLSDETVARVRSADLASLDRWIAAVLSSTSLEATLR